MDELRGHEDGADHGAGNGVQALLWLVNGVLAVALLVAIMLTFYPLAMLVAAAFGEHVPS